MIAQELVRQQNMLNRAARNLDAFVGEWVVLRDGNVADHDPKMGGLIDRDAIQNGDGLIFVADDTTGEYVF